MNMLTKGVEVVQKFVTSDGEDFVTAEQANEHQNRLNYRNRIKEFVADSTSQYYSSDDRGVVLDDENLVEYPLDNREKLIELFKGE